MDTAETGQLTDQVTPDIETQSGATSEEGKSEVELLQKRYSDSSREAKKLFEEKTRFEAEAKALRDQLSSLKNETAQTRPLEFPSKAIAVKSLVEQYEFSEKQAEIMYERDRATWEQNQELARRNDGLVNILRHMKEQNDKGIINMDPVSKEADEFCRDIPELNALPIQEKRARYLAIQEKKGVKVSGRDTTAAKLAAGGTVGGGARGSSSSSQGNDEIAKSLGWSGKALEDFATVKTDADMAIWQKKYPNFKI